MDSSENRQLAAITFIDIADFSELMHHDEAKAVHLLSLQKDIIYPSPSLVFKSPRVKQGGVKKSEKF